MAEKDIAQAWLRPPTSYTVAPQHPGKCIFQVTLIPNHMSRLYLCLSNHIVYLPLLSVPDQALSALLLLQGRDPAQTCARKRSDNTSQRAVLQAARGAVAQGVLLTARYGVTGDRSGPAPNLEWCQAHDVHSWTVAATATVRRAGSLEMLLRTRHRSQLTGSPYCEVRREGFDGLLIDPSHVLVAHEHGSGFRELQCVAPFDGGQQACTARATAIRMVSRYAMPARSKSKQVPAPRAFTG